MKKSIISVYQYLNGKWVNLIKYHIEEDEMVDSKKKDELFKSIRNAIFQNEKAVLYLNNDEAVILSVEQGPVRIEVENVT